MLLSTRYKNNKTQLTKFIYVSFFFSGQLESYHRYHIVCQNAIILSLLNCNLTTKPYYSHSIVAGGFELIS